MLLFLPLAARAAEAPLSQQQLAKLIQSLYSDDSNERISAVVELGEHAAEAAPALPHFKRVIAREQDPQIKKLMLETVEKIKQATGQR